MPAANPTNSVGRYAKVCRSRGNGSRFTSRFMPSCQRDSSSGCGSATAIANPAAAAAGAASSGPPGKGVEQIVEFASLQVSQDHPFKIIDRSQPGKKYGETMKGVYAPARGFVMQLGASTRLLATNGPDQIKRPLSPLPAPLLVHLHKRSTSKSLDALTEQILKFTSMTWRSTSPAAMPVTIYYSELIAELLARFRTLPDWSPALLNTKLRASKWFL